ncbi:C6 transcription factor [Paramyrothecium foliicola]|nr:C6 transcription factor [Paramyrothecium foliicola]
MSILRYTADEYAIAEMESLPCKKVGPKQSLALVDNCRPQQGASGYPSLGTKRKRRPRAPVACDTCWARKVKVRSGFLLCSLEIGHLILTTDFHVRFSINNPLLSYETPIPSVTDQRFCLSGHPTPSASVVVHEKEQLLRKASHDNSTRPPTQCSEGLGHTIEYTEGNEFYGSTETFYFLARLHSQAKNGGQPHSIRNDYQPRLHEQDVDDILVVNFLHSSDYSVRPGANDIISH